MGLLELWKENRDQLDDKRLHQLIAFAGDGRLLDGGSQQRSYVSCWQQRPVNVSRDGRTKPSQIGTRASGSFFKTW